ncbi:MAG: hypothetical protein FWD16_08300, partial [Clostridia bacterium]|nr:hypothetical protein [Clostridia bacterium]
MTDHERLMYQILGRISESDAPIVFKGALITKLILSQNGYTALDRATRDIDANWIDAPPSMDYLTGVVQRALGDMQEKFYAAASRE